MRKSGAPRNSSPLERKQRGCVQELRKEPFALDRATLASAQLKVLIIHLLFYYPSYAAASARGFVIADGKKMPPCAALRRRRYSRGGGGGGGGRKLIRRIYIGAPRRRLRVGPTLTQQYIKQPCATTTCTLAADRGRGELERKSGEDSSAVPPRMCLQEEACSAAAQEQQEEEEGNSI